MLRHLKIIGACTGVGIGLGGLSALISKSMHKNDKYLIKEATFMEEEVQNMFRELQLLVTCTGGSLGSLFVLFDAIENRKYSVPQS